MNTLKIILLMTFLTVLLVMVGQATFGSQGALMALGLAAVMNLATYFFSDRMVLAMYGAREATEAEAPVLFDVVRSLAAKAGIPMPRVAIIPQDAPNAFATGRDSQHAVVAATEGILRLADRDELEGVLAHEIGHVVNRDILLGAIAATLAGARGQTARARLGRPK
jgi:heat shock protein HtpX